MPETLVQYSVDRAIARIALDSPRNRNALSAALVSELSDALAEAAADDAVRAVELTHTGDQGLGGLFVSPHAEGWVLFGQSSEGNGHLLLVGLGLWLDGDGNDRYREDD